MVGVDIKSALIGFLGACLVFVLIAADDTETKNGNFGDIVDKVKPVFSQGGDDSGSGGTEQVVGKEGGSDIYGEASLADLGDDAVDLSLLSNNMEFDSTNIYDIQERQFKDVMLFPSDIQTVESDVSTQGEVSKEHAELVKNYFLQAAR